MDKLDKGFMSYDQTNRYYYIIDNYAPLSATTYTMNLMSQSTPNMDNNHLFINDITMFYGVRTLCPPFY